MRATCQKCGKELSVVWGSPGVACPLGCGTAATAGSLIPPTERYTIAGDGTRIPDSEHPFRGPQNEAEPISPILSLDDMNRKHTLETLDRLHGNKSETARVLGITVRTLYNWLNRWNVRDKYAQQTRHRGSP